MTATDPTYLGRVSAVSGSTITVRLAESLSSGLAMIDGHTYRVGQVGSFVRIPLGYQDLYGVVAEIGAAAAAEPIVVLEMNGQDTGRWMRVELAGEATGEYFERGRSQHPNADGGVHLSPRRTFVAYTAARKKIRSKLGRSQAPRTSSCVCHSMRSSPGTAPSSARRDQASPPPLRVYFAP